MSAIKEGEKVARVVGARFIKAEKSGSAALEVFFRFKEEDGSVQTLPWQGWLTPAKDGKKGALENTMKTLIEVLDFNGDDSIVQVPEGDPKQGALANPKALNMEKDVYISVAPETYEGKTFMRVRWVNKESRGSGSGFTGIAPEVIKNDLNAIGFKAMFHSIKNGGSAPAPSLAQEQGGFGGFGHSAPPESDLPF